MENPRKGTGSNVLRLQEKKKKKKKKTFLEKNGSCTKAFIRPYLRDGWSICRGD